MADLARLVSGALQTERLSDGHRKLLRELVVEVESETVTVPQNTETDFSTIPWLGRLLVHWSKVDIAGVVHDWLYQSGHTSRAHSDRVWRITAISGEHHANAIQGWAGWLALRLFGWIAWNRYRDSSASV